MPQPRSSLLTRRGLVAAGGALGLVAALTACGGGDSAAGGPDGKGSGAAAGAWTFKDDLGNDVTAKAKPKNVVAFTGTAAALYDYGVSVKGVFGPTTTADGKPDVQAGSMDISKVEVLGNAYGQFNVEKYAALQPDLLVTNTWDGTYWYVPEESKDKILKVAPAAAIRAGGGDVTMDKALARTAELAQSLGADLNAKKAVEGKARFEAASAKVREAVKANPGIKVLAGSGDAKQFYVSAPRTAADLSYFQQLGVEFVTPDKLDEGSTFFEGLSWENAGKYPADLILLDNRTSALQSEQLTKERPTWAALPAVKAGQVAPRVAEPVYSYDKCAQILEDLAKSLQNAKKVS